MIKFPIIGSKALKKFRIENFGYTEISLTNVYDIGFRHAAEMIKRNGGVESDNSFIINYQKPQTVPLEVCFEGIYPTERKRIGTLITDQNKEVSIQITGSGFVITGNTVVENSQKDIILEVDLYINNNLIEAIKMPTSFLTRKHDISWTYDIPEGGHQILLKAKHVPKGYSINIRDVIMYSSKHPRVRNYLRTPSQNTNI